MRFINLALFLVHTACIAVSAGKVPTPAQIESYSKAMDLLRDWDWHSRNTDILSDEGFAYLNELDAALRNMISDHRISSDDDATVDMMKKVLTLQGKDPSEIKDVKRYFGRFVRNFFKENHFRK